MRVKEVLKEDKDSAYPLRMSIDSRCFQNIDCLHAVVRYLNIDSKEHRFVIVLSTKQLL